MDSSSREEKDVKLQGGENEAEDCEQPAQAAQEDQQELELLVTTAIPFSDAGGISPETSAQENFPHLLLMPHLSLLNNLDEIEDQDPLPEDNEEDGQEEQEYIVLHPEHPLVKRQQAALNLQLRKRLEAINLEIETFQDSKVSDETLELFGANQKLATVHTKLEDLHVAKEQAEAKHRQTQDQLAIRRSQYSEIITENSKTKDNVSQLQAELDNLMQQLVFTKGVSEDLHSHVKSLKNAKNKAEVVKNQAEEQKLKQDLYVERLTKDLERLEQQTAMYDVQAKAQSEETQEAKEALSEAEMEVESQVMMRKQLLHKWGCSLVGMGQRDEAFSAMQEVVRDVKHQEILLDREIEGYKKSVKASQEHNETLTMQLNWSQMDCDHSKKQINQQQDQQEALQAHYTTCSNSLEETERTIARLNKEKNSIQEEVNDQRKQFEKDTAGRLEIEDKIVTNLQQKLTHNKAAKYFQRLASQITTQKREKISQLLNLENNIGVVEQESNEVSQQLESLTATQKAFDEEIAMYNKVQTAKQEKVSSCVGLMGQNQALIANYNKKIQQIAASTGHEDLSPMQIKINKMMNQVDELEANIKSVKQLWMKRQGKLIALTKEIEAHSKEILKLQIGGTEMEQRKMYLESQLKAERHNDLEQEKIANMLRGDLVKLNTLISEKRQLSVALEHENKLMEADFIKRLKEAEREFVEMQNKLEELQEEKEKLLNILPEFESKKEIIPAVVNVCSQQASDNAVGEEIQLLKETRSVVEKEIVQGDIKMMKSEIHLMEVHLNKLKKQREQLLRESEAVVARRESVLQKRDAMIRSSTRTTKKGELRLIIQGLKRKIKDTHKRVAEVENEIRQLQHNQATLSDRLTQKERQLVDLCGGSSTSDVQIINHQETKDNNLARIVTLQSRSKKLQGVVDGTYQAVSTGENIEASLEKQKERLHTISTILHRVCQEFPEHQGALRKLRAAVAASTQVMER